MSLGQRLRAERERLGLTQPALAAVAQTTKQTLFSWESGRTAPDGFQLAAMATTGLDPLYVLTGQYMGEVEPPPSLSDDERELLALYKAAPLVVKMAAVGALRGAASANSAAVNVRQIAHGANAVQVGNAGQFNNAPPTKRGK